MFSLIVSTYGVLCFHTCNSTFDKRIELWSMDEWQYRSSSVWILPVNRERTVSWFLKFRSHFTKLFYLPWNRRIWYVTLYFYFATDWQLVCLNSNATRSEWSPHSMETCGMFMLKEVSNFLKTQTITYYFLGRQCNYQTLGADNYVWHIMKKHQFQ